MNGWNELRPHEKNEMPMGNGAIGRRGEGAKKIKKSWFLLNIVE